MNAFMTVRQTLVQQTRQLMRQPVLNVPVRKSLLRFHHSTVMQERAVFSNDFFFRQLFDDVSCTYTYLLGDVETKEAVLIDPGEFGSFIGQRSN